MTPARPVALVPVLFAAVFFAGHVACLPPSLEDLDSINFALGVRDFDIARHQPHPPGYPIYIALTKLSTKVLASTGVDWPDVRGLSVWGVLFGALAAFPLMPLFRALGADDRSARAATALTIASPLFWFTANRPLSDVPGLVMALLAQAALGTAFVRQGRPRDGSREPLSPAVLAASGKLIVLGALLSALAIGLRAQAAWLTLPLLILVIVDRIGDDAAGAMLGSAMALTAGTLIWAVPMLVAIGGPARYVTALMNQGAEDLSGVQMLWTHPTSPRVAADAALHTFVWPWATPILAASVLGLAGVGAIVMAIRSRRALLLLAVAFGPYAVFHLLFHEAVTTRYALPVVPAMAWLAIAGVDGVTKRLVPVVAASLVVASLWQAMPALRHYAAAKSPVFRLFDDMEARRPAVAPEIVMHRRVSSETKRAREWRDGALPGPVRPSPRFYEWREAARYWLDGGRGPVWFLADPARTDLALIDPARRAPRGRYVWPFDERVYVGGARPSEIDWYEIDQPGWFLERGWALTAETAGVADRDGDGPHRRPAVGYAAHRDDEATLMIGGRHLGDGAAPAVEVALTFDGRTLDRWEQTPGFFVRLRSLPAGSLSGTGAFGRLAATSRATDESGRIVPVAIEQFDLQPAGAVVWGYERGWHEPEYNPQTGRQWRWMADRAVLVVRHGGQPLTVRIRGESPLRYFVAAPTVIVRAGTREVARQSPSDDFAWTIEIPAGMLDAPDGQIVVETDRSFVPAEQRSFRRNPDPRRLGLRIYDVRIDARGTEGSFPPAGR